MIPRAATSAKIAGVCGGRGRLGFLGGRRHERQHGVAASRQTSTLQLAKPGSGRGSAFLRLHGGRRLAGSKPSDIQLKAVVFDPLAREWEKRVAAALDSIREAGMLPALLDRLPQLIDGPHELKWSTTFLGGLFDESSRTIDLASYGDSGAVIAEILAMSSRRTITESFSGSTFHPRNHRPFLSRRSRTRKPHGDISTGSTDLWH